jgi:biotin operon repressor
MLFNMEKVNNDSIMGLMHDLLKVKEEIKERSYQPIEFSKPIISLDDQGIIYPNTLTVIQGKKGSHKSRLTESLCSLLLARENKSDRLGMRIDISKNPSVLYVDTERNQKDQFPYAIQQLRKKAGYDFHEVPENLDYLSLINVPRPQRFEILSEFIHNQEDKSNCHRVIVLDIVTDCVENFNDPNESLKLNDLINMLINKQEVSFICIIHENPGIGEKARGHLGTELINKASQVIQIGFNDETKELIKIKFLHSRMTRPLEPLYVQYSDEYKGLVLADSDLIQLGENNRFKAAQPEELKEWLGEFLKTTEAMSLSECYNNLMNVFHCSERTIEKRVKKLVDDGFLIKTGPGKGNKKFIKLNNQLETQPQKPYMPDAVADNLNHTQNES